MKLSDRTSPPRQKPMELLDRLESEARESALILLDWIGAVYHTSKDVPPELCTYNLAPILVELRQLIPLIEQFADQSELELPVLELLPRSIDDLEAEIARLPNDSPLLELVRPDTGTGKLMQGRIGRFPLYSLLPYRPQEASQLNHYRSYKATLLLIAELLKSFSAKTARDYCSAIATAANALRLYVDKHLLNVLPHLTDFGIEQTHAELEELRNSDEYAAESSTHNCFPRSLEKILWSRPSHSLVTEWSRH